MSVRLEVFNNEIDYVFLVWVLEVYNDKNVDCWLNFIWGRKIIKVCFCLFGWDIVFIKIVFGM